MRVLFATGREIDYPRNDVLLRAFRRIGQVEVIGERGSGSIVRRSLRFSLRLLPRLLNPRHDLLFIGFYGHFLMLPAGLLARRPVLFDAFVSTYDTLCLDRRRFSPRSAAGRLAFWLDRTTCRLADRVLLDTLHHARYFADTFALPPDRFAVLPVGCNEDLFRPAPLALPGPATRVLYYSSYLPLHGVETVVQAAARLTSHPIHFRLIGNGQAYNRVRQLANTLGLQNVAFIPPVPLDALPAEIAAADICLGGHFGDTPKAGRVVPGKIYQILAMARPLIAAGTPANRELLSHGETAFLCPPNDPDALAEAILRLHDDSALRRRLAEGGHALFQTECSEAVITARLRNIVRDMNGRLKARPTSHHD